MRKKFQRTAFTLMIAAIFLMSACTPATDNTNIQMDDSTVIGKQPSLADQVAYREAIKMKREDFCDKIRGENFKAKCKMDIADMRQYDKAVSEENPAHCDPIVDQELKEACKVELEIKTELKAESAKLQDESAKIDAIVASKNFARCKAELTLSQTISACQTNIATAEAVEKNNAGLCAQIEDDAGEKTCRETVSGDYVNPATG